MKRFLFLLLCFYPVIADGQGLDLGIRRSVPSAGGCSQATTFLGRTSGLSGTQTTAYTNLICGMVTDGTWSLMDVFYIFATNTTTTANLNLVSTNCGLTQPIAPAFTANQGYQGNGTTQYSTTNCDPFSAGGNFIQNSATVGACVLSSRTAAQNYVEIGNHGSNSASYTYIQPLQGTNQGSFTVNDNFPTATVSNAQGSWIVSRTGATATSFYLNGSSIGTDSTASSVVADANMYVGALNSTGTTLDYSTDLISYAFYGGGLTSAQVTSLYNRLHTFLVAVGATGAC